MKKPKESFLDVEASLKSLHFQKASPRLKRVLWQKIEAHSEGRPTYSFVERIFQSLRANLFPIASGLVAAAFVFIVFQNIQQQQTPQTSFINPAEQVSQYIEKSHLSLRRVNILLSLEKEDKKIALGLIPRVSAEQIFDLTPEIRNQLAMATVRVMKNNTQAIETMSDVNETKQVIKLLGDIEELNQKISQDFSRGITKLYSAGSTSSSEQDNNEQLASMFNAAIKDSQKNADQIAKTLHSVETVSKSSSTGSISVSIHPSNKTIETAQTLGIDANAAVVDSSEETIETLPVVPEERQTRTIQDICEVQTKSCKKSQPREEAPEEVPSESGVSIEAVTSPVTSPSSSIQKIEEVFIEKVEKK